MNSDKLKFLINNFQENITEILSTNSNHTESDTRSEFIDPFFKLLGWDMDNSSGLSSFNKEVKRENFNSIDDEKSQIPDYIFKIKNNNKFIIEAKKVSEDIKKKKHTFQIRKYGYSAGLPISAITNFNEIRIFDTNIEPKITDEVDNSLLFECKYLDYIKNFNTLNTFLGRKNIVTQEWNNLVKFQFDKRPSINKNFLTQIDDWRLRLANGINNFSEQIDIEEINYLSQKIVNRFIFIRVCEDRVLTKFKKLNKSYSNPTELTTLFTQYNQKFNSNIFKLEKDEKLLKDNNFFELLKIIIDEFYHPFSPYNFAVFYADFFGDVYEVYLINIIKKDSGNLVLSKKDDYMDRDIVSTPNPIVDKILKETLNTYFDLTNENPTILDPAMGSGRFLLLAYDYMLDKSYDGNVVTIGDKIKILKSLFGIDKDYLAIDTAKFSLYMKILEDENYETLNTYSKFLPDLEKNIIFGNSIIDTDFNEEDKSIQPLNWETTFDDKKFDIIVGNPPYVKTEDIKKNIAEYEYIKNKYKTSFKQFDKYFSFIEKSLAYLNPNGFLTFVVPSSWINQGAGQNLRKILKKPIYKLVNFTDANIFDERSNYTCVLYLSNKNYDSLRYFVVNKHQDWLSNETDYFEINKNILNFDIPLMLPANNTENLILEKIHNKTKSLNEKYIKTGIQTSKDEIYVIKNFVLENRYIFFSKNGTEWKIEQEACKPYISDSLRINSFQILKPDSFLIFPYYSDEEGNSKILDHDMFKEKFPKTFEYLSFFKEELMDRAVNPPISNNSNDFYKYGRSQNISTLTKFPKLILTVNQKGDKYAVDDKGVYFTSGGTAGEISIFNNEDDDYIYFILGLLDQHEIEFFFSKRGSPKAGGYFTRGKDVMSDLPVPIINSHEDKARFNTIVTNVKLTIKETNKENLNTRDRLISKNSINTNKEKIRNEFLSLWQRT